MKEYIEFLLTQIINNPDELTVEEQIDGTEVNIYICAAEEDMPIVIGKRGKTIKSLRDLARVKAIKDRVKVNIQVC